MADIEIESPRAGVTVLRLNRPDQLNALTREMVVDLGRLIGECGRDPACRVLVLTGAGRGFCAGLDLRAASARNSAGSDTSITKFDGQESFAAMVQAMRRLKIPVIAAVNGAAAGAGFALTLGADVRVAARSAKFHVAAVKIGLSAGECGISYHLPRYVGASRAFEIMLTGRPIDAAEAERIGLVSRLVDDGQALPAALEIAAAICANAPFSVRETKRIMWRSVDASSLDAALDMENPTQIVASLSEDFKEAAEAFVGKRTPDFHGR
ncbi:MAG: enoyl-CoA hydratase/isomerase family protein [Gammaproteobacteria bacterium]